MLRDTKIATIEPGYKAKWVFVRSRRVAPDWVAEGPFRVSARVRDLRRLGVRTPKAKRAALTVRENPRGRFLVDRNELQRLTLVNTRTGHRQMFCYLDPAFLGKRVSVAFKKVRGK